MPPHAPALKVLNGQTKRQVLDIQARPVDLDPAVEIALHAVKARYTDQQNAAEKLIADEGITIDVERLRDALQRGSFGPLEQLLLAQPGVPHRFLLDALDAERVEGEEELERKRERAHYKAEKDQTGLLAETLATLTRITDQNQQLLRKLLEDDRRDKQAAARRDDEPKSDPRRPNSRPVRRGASSVARPAKKPN